jgi:hypothetical protein
MKLTNHSAKSLTEKPEQCSRTGAHRVNRGLGTNQNQCFCDCRKPTKRWYSFNVSVGENNNSPLGFLCFLLFPTA